MSHPNVGQQRSDFLASGMARWARQSLPQVLILVGVCGFFAAATAVMLYPLSVNPSDYAREPGDTLLNTWILAWVSKTLFTDPAGLFNGNIFYPFPYSLAFSEVLVADIPIAAPVIWATGNPLLAHNVVLLSSFFLCGVTAFLLGRHLTGSIVAGLVSGVIFAFAPYKFGQIAHVQLLTAQWMPLALLLLMKALSDGRLRYFVGFAFFFALQALSSFYYAIIFSVAVGLYVLYAVAIQRSIINKRLIGYFAVAAFVVVVMVLPFSLTYFDVQRQYGFSRNIAELKGLSANISDYLVAPDTNNLYGRITAPLLTPTGQNAEHWLFTGVVPVLLAFAGLISIRRLFRKPASPSAGDGWRTGYAIELGAVRAQWYFVWLGLCAFVLSFGPVLMVFGRDTGIILPYYFLYEYVPGFKALRVPTRFDILVMLALAVLAAYGMQRLGRLMAEVPFGRGLKTLVGALVVATILIEYASVPQPVVAVPTGASIPPVYQWLAAQAQGTTVVELPATIPRAFWYEYYSSYHWKRLVNGHSGFMPEAYWEIVREVGDFPSRRSQYVLSGLGVQYAIVHGDGYSSSQWAKMRQLLASTAGLNVVQQFGDDIVVSIAPSPASVGVPIMSVDFPTQVRANQVFNLALRLSNGTDETAVYPPGTNIRAIVEWDGQNSTAESSVAAPIVLGPGATEQVALPVIAPADFGSRSMRVRIDGLRASLSESAAILVQPELARSTESKGLRAEIVECRAPDPVAAGANFTVECEVINTGESVWLAAAGARGGVGLGVRRWTNDSAGEVSDKNGRPLGARQSLKYDLYPGQSVVLKMLTVAPSAAGHYIIVIDLVSEHVAWFDDLINGVAQLHPVTVQ